MRQEMMGVGDAVASAGPLQTISTSLQTDDHINTQWRQREFKVGGDEPCEQTVRLPD